MGESRSGQLDANSIGKMALVSLQQISNTVQDLLVLVVLVRRYDTTCISLAWDDDTAHHHDRPINITAANQDGSAGPCWKVGTLELWNLEGWKLWRRMVCEITRVQGALYWLIASLHHNKA